MQYLHKFIGNKADKLDYSIPDDEGKIILKGMMEKNIIRTIAKYPQYYDYITSNMDTNQLLIVYGAMISENDISQNCINSILINDYNNLFINCKNDVECQNIILDNFFNKETSFFQMILEKRLFEKYPCLTNEDFPFDIKSAYLGPHILGNLLNHDTYKTSSNKIIDIVCPDARIIIKGFHNVTIHENKFVLKYDDIYFVFYERYETLTENILNHHILYDWNHIYCSSIFLLHQKFQNIDLNLSKINHTTKISGNIKIHVAKKMAVDTLKYMSGIIAPSEQNHDTIDAHKNICAKQCYHCKKIYPLNKHFGKHWASCWDCGVNEYEMNKIINNSNLTGKIALITGGRVKIGYLTALKLLRLGCMVFVTSRFPSHAQANFMEEKDYDDFKDRLNVIGIDFLMLRDVEKMIKELSVYRFDIIINNACQTVKPSKHFMSTMFRLDNEIKYALTNGESNATSLTAITLREEYKMTVFKDLEDIQPAKNSWNKKIEEYDSMEIAEVQVINNIVPTMIISKLKPLMNKPSFIVNVTSMEGTFYGARKTGSHAHTNASKAALDMLTCTLADEFRHDGVHIYSVDPGYVSGVITEKSKDKIFPLTMEDGANRILHPIVFGYNGKIIKEIKLKNYIAKTW
jgi:NAD(P)-dependent dehydrogenase (short-subunit alcohol dehydrogenase family)